MKQWLLCWLVLSCCQRSAQTSYCKRAETERPGVSDAISCMENVTSILKSGKRLDTIKAIKSLKQFLEETQVDNSISVVVDRLVAFLYKPFGSFRGLQIHANDGTAQSEVAVPNSNVDIQVPRELDVGPNNTITFCMVTFPESRMSILGGPGDLYEGRLVGLSVRGKTFSSLQERVNITMIFTSALNDTYTPRCVFFDFSTKAYSSNGCMTLWKHDQINVTCSCDHLTYFGVLMVSASLQQIHQEILTYITLIGCSVSLFTLLITVLLFITNRRARADVSMKVHINLAIALILLNLHFLPSQMVAALSSNGLCIYLAVSIHYSLLATFSWIALEGFHLYLLFIKVFNIYIRRYLLKLSVVGWSIPAVIVALVVIIEGDAYGPVPLDFTKPNNTKICYIRSSTVKTVTTVGVFTLVFIFNVIMFGVIVRRVVSLRRSKEDSLTGRKKFGENERDRAKRDIFTLLGVITLLGITFGLVFFSFGYLTTPGLYFFCVLNSLQGFFIFLWFVMSLRKTGNSIKAKTSTETRCTNS